MVERAFHAAKLQGLAELKAAHNNPAYSKMSFMMGLGVQDRGEDSRVFDESGNSFIAMFDQYGNQSFGYSYPDFVACAIEKLKSGNINSTKIFFEEDQINLAHKLFEASGGHLQCAYFANGGGETIDNALKLARARKPRGRIISAQGCFHGKTFATLTASARPEHFELFEPMLPGFQAVPFGDEDALVEAMGEDVAAVLLEPVQAENGIQIPPVGYLSRARDLCDKFGAALIFDEMQTAFGRTGSLFAFQEFDVIPDMICLGKAFGGGIVPISAVVAKQEYWEILKTLPSTFGSSLGGNPLSCRVALEVLKVASEPNFLRSVRQKGGVIARHLAVLAEKYRDVLVDVRGVGMMFGLELKDDATAGLMLRLLLDEGVTSTYSLYNTRVIRIQPPMVISDVDLELGLAAFDKAFSRIRDLVSRGQVEESVSRKISLTVDSSLPYQVMLERLNDDPFLLDPVVVDADRQPSSDGFRVKGAVNGTDMMWNDRVESAGDRIRVHAVPNWVWAGLEREYVIRKNGGGSSVDVCVSWDAGAHYYEDFLALSIGYVARESIIRKAAALEASNV